MLQTRTTHILTYTHTYIHTTMSQTINSNIKDFVTIDGKAMSRDEVIVYINSILDAITNQAGRAQMEIILTNICNWQEILYDWHEHDDSIGYSPMGANSI